LAVFQTLCFLRESQTTLINFVSLKSNLSLFGEKRKAFVHPSIHFLTVYKPSNPDPQNPSDRSLTSFSKNKKYSIPLPARARSRHRRRPMVISPAPPASPSRGVSRSKTPGRDEEEKHYIFPHRFIAFYRAETRRACRSRVAEG
jgi:hypothetical protein